jgi:hypothetical protein
VTEYRSIFSNTFNALEAYFKAIRAEDELLPFKIKGWLQDYFDLTIPPCRPFFGG